jgi:putative transcriptional regulator
MSDDWPLWNDLDCRALRKRLGLSQRQFAHRFNFPVSTLRQWEQGKRRPSGAALALLHVIAYQPAVATRAVIRARNAAGALQRTD